MPRSLPRAVVLALIAACTVYNTPTVSEVPRPRPTDSVMVTSPVKAHLLDGSTVVFRSGFVLVRDTLRSPETEVRYQRVGQAVVKGSRHVPPTAYRFNLTLTDSAPVDVLPLDSVLGMENFRNSVNGPGTAVLSVLGAAAGVVLVAGVVVAIECLNNPKCFGSCPTIYSDSAGTAVLEAEGFSYSIAPLFEARDVDRLRATPDTGGDLRLEVRNEALETHYINQLGVLEVHHARDELVVPDGGGHPIAVRSLVPPTAARDRAGRDVLASLRDADGLVFRTDSTTIARASVEDPSDHIDLSFPAPRGVDSVALVFRMRNSLLNTVLLYELMLADRGALALDWMGQDLQEIGPAVRLGRWYADHMGMRVAMREAEGFRPVARIPDTGPVAWKDVGVFVPVPPGTDTIHLRLSFAADDWRIDRVALALRARRPAVRTLEPIQVQDANARPDTGALASLRTVDQRYLVTSPGQRFTIHFATGRSPADSARTFLLVSEGYYLEWMRNAWLRGPHADSTFQPTDQRLIEALQRWDVERETLEHRFYATRVPVR